MKQLKEAFLKMIYILDAPQKTLCVFVFIMTCVGSLLECLGVSAIVPLVQVIQEPSSLLNTSFAKNSRFISSLTYNQLVLVIGGAVIAIYILKNLFFIFLSWVKVKFSCKIQREIAVKMMTSYLSRGYQFFLDINYGQYVRGISGDTSTSFTVIYAGFNLLSESITIILICAFMFVTDWMMATTVVVLALLCVLLIYFFFRKKMYDMGMQLRKYSIKADQALAQSYYGIKDVLLLRKQVSFIGDFETNRIQMQKAQAKQEVGGTSPAYIIEGICVSGLLLAVCIRIVIKGADPYFIASLAAFAVGAFRILPSLGRITVALNSLTSSLSSVNALYKQIIEAEEYAKEHPEATFGIEKRRSKYGLIDQGNKYNEVVIRNKDKDEPEEFHDKLELKNISFSYKEELGYVLKDINLEIKKGQSVAFIGSSGAGKSTLMDILLGLLIPQNGGVYMDGVNITDIPEKWASVIGYVPQSVFLSDASIKMNVAFGENENAIDEERVKEALERAELLSFVNSLPEGMETQVGDRGVRLSGGQRQRIAIARALYHRPEIMVLDEATSALDNETEKAIMSAIDSLQGEVTLIIVAHRLTTVKNCDIIYEVNNSELAIRDKADILKNI